MEEAPINKYGVTVVVEYYYEVEALNSDQAQEEGWNYEDYSYAGSVYSINTSLIEEDIYGEEPEEEE
jgi:hypothetical protein